MPAEPNLQTKPAPPPQAKPDFEALLIEAGSLWGIAPEFWDIWGERHEPSPEVVKAILRSLGVACETETELSRSIRDYRRAQWSRALPSTLVVAAGAPGLPVRVLQAKATGSVEFVLTLENGTRHAGTISLANLEPGGRAEIDRVPYVQKTATLPVAVPEGYHTLELTLGSMTSTTALIATPDRAWLPDELVDGARKAGIAVSLYGVRSARNWGVGDFGDLDHLLTWLHNDLSGAFVALNPLHALENRQPYNISPYLPASIFFRNPLYLDMERIPEFAVSQAAQRCLHSPAVQNKLGELRRSEFVEYEQVWRLKLVFLAILFRELLRHQNPARFHAFERFVEAGGERLDRYATYCALWRHLHRRDPDLWIWPNWPEQYRDPQSGAVAEFRTHHQRQVLFYKYLQFLVDEQLAEIERRVRELHLPIGLYHDMALATDKCGADLWAYRDFFVPGCRVGSPPDDFAPQGQDWGFPPPNTRAHRENAYRLFIDGIRASSRHGGALRIDHVMRLFRLFWIPDAVPASDGVYVGDFHEDLLRILALESWRNRFLIVGEDLGTVTDEMREDLARFGILSYRVFYFEKTDAGAYLPPEEYPPQALVTSTTHDLPTLAGYWTGRDIEARRAAGLLSEESVEAQRASREQDKQSMLDRLHSLHLLPDWFPRRASDVAELTGELHNAIIGFLVGTPSILLALNQEDLTKESEQQNLPGSTWQYPNWRRKMRFTVEELRQSRLVRDYSTMLRNWLVTSGRIER